MSGDTRLIAGRYEKAEQIGMGGMGTVYRGIDTITGDVIAIKELKPDIIHDDPDIIVRFAREGEALRKLNHPSIVKVFAAVEDENVHYIIMEYIDSGSLRERLLETPQMAIDEILNIGLDLSDALARAHRLKIIHRDIKPANVLIAADGTPRLTDFGIARMGDTTNMTKTGALVGTLSYLPPEMIEGKPIDERADIWAFGVMLYEMLTGVRPFESENPAALLHNVLTGPVPDILQFRDYETIGSWGLPGLIYWMLEKERERRPKSARMVGAVLETLLSGELPSNNFMADIGSAAPKSLPPELTAQAMRDYSSSAFQVDSTPTPGTTQTSAASAEDPVEPFSSATLAPPDSTGNQRRWLMPVAALVVLILVGVGIVLASGVMNSDSDGVGGSDITALAAQVEPIADDEWMMLVAQIEHIGGAERDVQRFIVDDLKRQMEDTVAISNFRIRAYPGVITDSETAIEVAEAVGAYGIIWGNYDDNFVDVNLQLGDVSQLPPLVFTEEQVRTMVDARFRMTNERQQTLAFGVGGLLTGSLAFTNYEFMEIPITQVVLDTINTPSAEVVGNTISSWYYRFIIDWLPDPASAAEHMSQAIQLDAGNPTLYNVRAFAHYRSGNLPEAREDIATALEFGPENWISPYGLLLIDALYFQNDLPKTLEYVENMSKYAPDEWYVYTDRGFVHLLMGEYDLAEPDIMRSIENSPGVNMPYPAGISIALRKGNFPLALSLYQEMKERFPDPSLTERALQVTLPEDLTNFIFALESTAFGNLTLGRWQSVLDATQEIIDGGRYINSDVYFLRGLAYCNLDNSEAAEEAYTEAIALEPDYNLLYFLRAEARRNLGNLLGATADVAVVLASDQADSYRPLINAASSDISCKNFLDLSENDLRALGIIGAEATEEAG